MHCALQMKFAGWPAEETPSARPNVAGSTHLVHILHQLLVLSLRLAKHKQLLVVFS